MQGAKDAVVILSNLDLAFWGDYTAEQADRALKAFEGFGGKAAESLNNIVKIADNLDFEVAEERFSEFAKAIEEDTHLTTQQSEAIFEAYLRRRKQQIEDEQKAQEDARIAALTLQQKLEEGLITQAEYEAELAHQKEQSAKKGVEARIAEYEEKSKVADKEQKFEKAMITATIDDENRKGIMLFELEQDRLNDRISTLQSILKAEGITADQTVKIQEDLNKKLQKLELLRAQRAQK